MNQFHCMVGPTALVKIINNVDEMIWDTLHTKVPTDKRYFRHTKAFHTRQLLRWYQENQPGEQSQVLVL